VKRNFLVVSANGQQREALAGELRARGYTVTRAASGREAERTLKSVSFDAVLLESQLPDTTADRLRNRLQKRRPDCRIVVLTSFEDVRNSPRQLEFGNDHYLVDSAQIFDLLRTPADGGAGDATPSAEQRGNLALIEAIDVLVGLLELDDRFFGGTSHKAMSLARQVAEQLTRDSETVQEIVIATLLRDVGKAALDPGEEPPGEASEYTKEQRARMQEHVSASTRLLEHIDFPWKVLPIIRHHHERYDGTGYPDGLRGREIPMGARIVAVVDAFMAVTSDRRHRQATTADSALNELVLKAGRQFDPEVVEAFQTVLDKNSVDRPTSRKPTVLLADPQDEYRKLLKLRLLNDGCDVVETERLDEVIRLLLEEPPELVLVDLEADGFETFGLLQEVREDEALCRIPFAVLARGNDRLPKIRALRAGVDDYLCKTDSLDEIVARVQNVLTREAIRAHGGSKRRRRGITGDLENLGLADIVQTLTMGMKTARVSLTSGSDKGRIWFENGAAKHAQSDGVKGDEAFFRMVRWTEGDFVIEHGLRTKEQSIQQDAMFLLMEGLRQLDEAQRDSARSAS